MNGNLIVIGGGPGGYAAALTAAGKGVGVTLIEHGEMGGTCLNRGCIPTKALLASSELYEKIKLASRFGIRAETVEADMAAIGDRKNKVVQTIRTNLEGLLKKRGVNIVRGRGKLAGGLRVTAGEETLEAENIILATGSEPARIWQGEHILTSDEALELTELPKSLLVVGAGAVGLEFACFFSQLGTKVTVVEMLPRILPAMDGDVVATLARELKKRGVVLKTGCSIEEIEGNRVRFSDGKEGVFDKILQAVGRKFNTENLGLENVGVTAEKGRIATDKTMQTSAKGIYAVGDIAQGAPLLAHSATAQGIVAALNIAGEPAGFDGSLIPGCIYTHPETAGVGMLETDLDNPLTASVPYRILGRSHAGGEIAGLLKIVADGTTREVKGVHIIGERAADLVHEGLTAIRMHATIEEMADTVRAHPTFSELYTEAYHLMEGRPIHAF